MRGSILELTTISQDFRFEVVGGVLGALDIWNIAIVPSLLTNCSVWTEMSEALIKLCEEQQNMLVRSLLKMPGLTPIPALRALTGLLGFQWRIWQEKLLLVVAIRKAEGTLTKLVLEEQLTMGWPGLCQEVTKICDTIGLPDVCQEDVDKSEVREAVFWHHYKVLKEEMEPLKKLQQLSERGPQEAS